MAITSKKSLILLSVLALVAAAALIFVWLQPKPYLALTPAYPLITDGDLVRRAAELHDQKVCLSGEYASVTSRSNLVVGTEQVWVTRVGVDERVALRCATNRENVKSCQGKVTICGTLRTAAGSGVSTTNMPYCCGRGLGWKYEILGE